MTNFCFTYILFTFLFTLLISNWFIIVKGEVIRSSQPYSSMVDVYFSASADDSFELYYNNVELPAADFEGFNSTPCNGTSKYCCNKGYNEIGNRCHWEKLPEKYNLTAESGDIIGLKYYNTLDNPHLVKNENKYYYIALYTYTDLLFDWVAPL